MSPRRPSSIWGWMALAGISGVATGYVLLGTWLEIDDGFAADWGTLVSPLLQRHIMESIVTIWFAFLGGCFGSFLNVVIYRLPARRTLFGNSGCPRCGHAIRPQHNIPIIGWLFLQGKCRDCRLPIAVRYPIVEGLVTLVFLAITFGEILPGGNNLPNFTRSTYPGVVGVVLAPQWELLTIAMLHAAVLTILISWAFIAYDGHPIPTPFAVSVLVVIGGLTVVFPHLVPVRTLLSPDSVELIGLAAGAGVLSWYSGAVRGRREPRRSLTSVVCCYLLVGTTFGGSATVSVFLLEGMIRATLVWFDRRGIVPWGLPLCVAALIQTLLWRWLTIGPWWPHLGDSFTLAAGLAVAFALNIAFVSPNAE